MNICTLEHNGWIHSQSRPTQSTKVRRQCKHNQFVSPVEHTGSQFSSSVVPSPIPTAAAVHEPSVASSIVELVSRVELMLLLLLMLRMVLLMLKLMIIGEWMGRHVMQLHDGSSKHGLLMLVVVVRRTNELVVLTKKVFGWTAEMHVRRRRRRRHSVELARWKHHARMHF